MFESAGLAVTTQQHRTQTGEATTYLWDDGDTAWQRSLDIGQENPLLFSTVVRRP